MKYKTIIKDYEKIITKNIDAEIKEENNEPLQMVKSTWWIKLLNKFRKLKK